MNRKLVTEQKNVFISLPDKCLPDKPIIITSGKHPNNDRYDELLCTFSSVSKYDETTWLIDRMFTERYFANGERRISFSKCDSRYVAVIKQYTLSQLLNHTSIHAIQGAIHSINIFFSFLSGKAISETSEINIQDYYQYYFGNNHINLALKTRIKHWVETKYFLSVMEYNNIRLMMEKYNTPHISRYVKAPRYIPEEIAIQIDLIMKRNNYIPSVYKFMYWTLRLIPNRFSEVLNCQDDCLKQLTDTLYTISIPTYKQEGPYQQTVRVIYIKNEDVGKMYIDIVKETIKAAKQIDNRKMNLICYQQSSKRIWDPSVQEMRFIPVNNCYHIVSLTQFNKFLANLCQFYNIQDQNGYIYKPTSHCFRHNATSDRINSGLFRDVDVQALTFHANTEMINKAYYHSPSDQYENDSVYFKGRIIKCDDNKVQQVLRKPYAITIRGLGICSDSRSCNKNKSQCLFCSHMTPDCDKLDEYINSRDEWIKKKQLALETKNKDYENLCDQWIDGYTLIIRKVENFISKKSESI